jgi:hypothetical protein
MREPRPECGARRIGVERMEAAGGEGERTGARNPDQGEGAAAGGRRESDYRVGERAGASRRRRFAIMYCCGMLKRFCAA